MSNDRAEFMEWFNDWEDPNIGSVEISVERRAAWAAWQAARASRQQTEPPKPVAKMYRGGTDKFGRANVLSTWLDAAAQLPDGEHLLYASPLASAPLLAILPDLIEMAQEHADQFSAAFEGYKPERHAYNADVLERARALISQEQK